MDPEGRFQELVRDRTGQDFVEREWLYEEIERACAAEATQHVLVTGEPGAGKTSLMAGLARRHPEWLRYFVRHDSLSRPEETGLTAFLLTVGHELKGRRQELFETERLKALVTQDIESVAPGGRVVGVQVDHLTVSPFRATAMLQVEQRITKNAGDVIGVAAGSMTVDPRLERPEILAHLALIDPARLLLQDDPAARIVLLVDGIDELSSAPGGGGLLDWLMAGPELPSNIRVVLTSREHEMLQRLRLGRPGRLAEIRIEPASRQVTADLTVYAERALMTPPTAGLICDLGHDPADFLRRVVKRAAGNFQYLAAYRRGVDDVVDRRDGSAAARLLTFEDLPAGLDALYGVLMITVRESLEPMGQVAARDPTHPQPHAWRDVGRPVLGVLTVAREPLTAGEISGLADLSASREATGDVLRRLRMLLDTRDSRMALFHASLADFLTRSDPADPDGPSWAVDAPYWHGRIVQHYRGEAESWDAVDWRSVNRYGLVHLAWHLLRSPHPLAADALRLVCPGLRSAIRAALGTDRHLLRITELVAGHAIEHLPLAEALPAVMFLGVLRRQLLRVGYRLPPAVFGLMARMGRTQETLERMRAIPASEHQFEALREILRYLPEEHGSDDRAELIELLVNIAVQVGNAKQIYLAAEVLAPHDLQRALSLWERGRSDDWWKPPDAPDAVYLAVANTAMPTEATAHIAQMRSGRCAAFLDLAGRTPRDAVSGLLRKAELSLASAPPGERIGNRARLAAAWLPHDGNRAIGHLDAALTEADRELKTATERGKKEELAKGMASAATVLPPELREFARILLDRVEQLPDVRWADDEFVRAIGLRLEWGEHDRAQAIIRRFLAGNDTAWCIAKIAGVLQRHDPAEARRLMERVRASGQGRPATPPDGMASRLDHNIQRRALADSLADMDPEWAAETAREITKLSWGRSDSEPDRYTTLAQIAHVQIERGREDLAESLLEEALCHAETPPPLGGEDRGSVPYRHASQGIQAERTHFHDKALDTIYLANIDLDWDQHHRRRRLFLEPADVVRAVLPGPTAVGNPYGWARTLRSLAESVAVHEHDRASRLVRSLTDRAETAVGLAALVTDAAHRGDTARANRLWQELETALARIEPYTWTGDSRDRDNRVWAYLRPDHRARFEVAMRIMPTDPDRGLDLVRETFAPYLQFAYSMSFACWASGMQIYSDHPWSASFAAMHRSMLQRSPGKDCYDPLIVGIAMARATVNERMLAASQGRAPEADLGAAIPDEVCAAHAALISPDGTAALGPQFLNRVRALLGTSRRMAAAELCAFAATIVPADDPRLQALCQEVLAACRMPDRDLPTIDVGLCFAASPALAGLVDFPALAKIITERANNFGNEYGAEQCRLFPILLARDPQWALRLLFKAVEESWPLAMAMLEHSAAWLVQDVGTGVATDLHKAIVRGLECSSPPGSSLAAEVDGVRLQLAQPADPPSARPPSARGSATG